eukprot:CAMPEP_0175602620 /NCGR_PEP_ID=MMETSP0096-20121207/58733_1 /TAXON_ID=311494 /ORGANISM="Alexandrium monilatum, Strain CCMP3105" /LENGTH=39 /DNA_ID= /DNA_START= /DNA_END= /DNA_ORIENTATION=
MAAVWTAWLCTPSSRNAPSQADAMRPKSRNSPESPASSS